MKAYLVVVLAAFLCTISAVNQALGVDVAAVHLPKGVAAVWDIDKAYRETTPTRERISINGLWQWQPAEPQAEGPPRENWGYFKVPGPWPGASRSANMNGQAVYAHPSWKDTSLGGLTAAWYQREISVPSQWHGRRIALSLEYLNSHATVYVDGKKAGELSFPAGQLDLTSVCRPGSKHVLSVLVAALPLQDVTLKFRNTNDPKKARNTVARRGLCGDLYLVSTPPGPRISDVLVATSVRKGEITLNTRLEGLAAEGSYALRAVIADHGRTVAQFTGKPFKAAELVDGRIAVSEKWKPEKLWDLNTPQNTYEVTVSLLAADGHPLDAGYTERFGFRELWIDGRDLYLNGTRIFLFAHPLSNPQAGAGAASYQSAKKTMLRLKDLGFNFVYMLNYDCQPGIHLSFAEVLQAADDTGMLVALTQPHYGQYDWTARDAGASNGYDRHARFYCDVAGNHPAVVFYATSHNSTGYPQDMNPDLIDGLRDSRTAQWAKDAAQRALQAEAIIKRLDPTRIVYHHAGGNLGAMHTINFYPNWVPLQEMCDWFGHWATEGVKPAFACEFSAPFAWDWGMYRGWYKGVKAFGDARAPWEFCLAEWNAQSLGDRAFRISQQEKANLRAETKLFRTRDGWTRNDYPSPLSSTALDERYPVYAEYITREYRAFRTWGVSAVCPWDLAHYWQLRRGVDTSRKELAVDWEHLQRPGFSADYIDGRGGKLDLGYDWTDWTPTVAAEAMIRNNRPLLAYIGGKSDDFTSQDHNFLPGETVEKLLILINNSRQSVSCRCEVSSDVGQPTAETGPVNIATGQQQRLPLRLDIPAAAAPGTYTLRMTAKFTGGEVQQDSFVIHVLPPTPAATKSPKIAVFDPKGETARLLDAMGLQYRSVQAGADLAGVDILVVGKAALAVDAPGLDVTNVRKGLRVIVFEQTSDVLEQRFGFRVAAYGLRTVFPRLPDHPALAGLKPEHLRDWRGQSTIQPRQLKYETNDKVFAGAPTIQWCGIPVTRLWRCGNRGNVASVLIEKPARGNFLPIIDGGFSLQYSPLIEYREGEGMVLFCQMDVTGRTETDPAAQQLAHNLFQYVSDWKPAGRHRAVYVGDPAGHSHLEKAGIAAASYEGGAPSADQVLVVGPGGGKEISANAPALAAWLKSGGHLLAIGIDQPELTPLFPKLTMTKAEHIAAYFEPPATGSLLAGIGPADVHNRDPRVLPLVTGGATVIGDGVLGETEGSAAVFCQLVPWQFDYSKQYNIKRTFRRASFLLARLLGNLGVESSTPLLARFNSPVNAAKTEKRWLDGLYLDQPEEWDDPYRFFRW